MRAAVFVVIAAACGAKAPERQPQAPVIGAPDAIDLRMPGAVYLRAVAGKIQPSWSQFLTDCRLRLPAAHPLNVMTLATTAELAIDAHGHLAASRIAPSGNADFDRAIAEVLADAAELAAPPRDLLADDDRVHVRWSFARDRRQAGPATAALVPMRLPLAEIVPRLLAGGELPRAARRIAIESPSAERSDAIRRLMIAALAEALAAPDDDVRAAALDAITRARVGELTPGVRPLLAPTTSAQLRQHAIAAIAAIGDHGAAPALLAALPADLAADSPAIALAETRALVALGQPADADRAIAASHAAYARAVHCETLVAAQLRELGSGLAAGDAAVRAACADAAGTIGAGAAPLAAKLVELARDRDDAVRARAIEALGAIDPARVPANAVTDEAPVVRAAFARALAARPDRAADVRALVDDADPGVRLAAVPAVIDLAALARLAGDAAPDVRTAALVRIAQLRGRGAIEAELIERLAAAPQASAERTRIALAWLSAGG